MVTAMPIFIIFTAPVRRTREGKVEDKVVVFIYLFTIGEGWGSRYPMIPYESPPPPLSPHPTPIPVPLQEESGRKESPPKWRRQPFVKGAILWFY